MSENQDKKNQSEVARIREQIALEAEAAQRAMHGFHEGASKHAFITARLERIGQLHDELSEIDEYATQYLVDTLQDSADEAEVQRLFAEFDAVPSYFERFKKGKEVRDHGKE